MLLTKEIRQVVQPPAYPRHSPYILDVTLDYASLGPYAEQGSVAPPMTAHHNPGGGMDEEAFDAFYKGSCRR